MKALELPLGCLIFPLLQRTWMITAHILTVPWSDTKHSDRLRRRGHVDFRRNVKDVDVGVAGEDGVSPAR